MPRLELPAPSTPVDARQYVDPVGRVRCAFLRVHLAERSIDYASVNPGTGSSAWRMRLRNAAELWATQFDYRMWAMPGLVQAAPGDWLIYERGVAGRPTFLKRLPTQEAAEMWMLHGSR